MVALKPRLFTFGCSFTNYRWSTWADILGAHYQEYYNWGQSGAGNQYIFNSFVEANERYKICPGDTVIICWTNVMREDRYTDQWQTLGNITTCPIYNSDYVKNAVTERGCLIRDLASMRAVLSMLRSKKYVTWRFLSMSPIAQPYQFDNQVTSNQDVLTLYRSVLNTMLPSFQETVFNNGWRTSGDPHPTPLEHLEYLDRVLPGWVTSEDIRVKIKNETENLLLSNSGMAQHTRLQDLI